jgi:hypothetical protein
MAAYRGLCQPWGILSLWNSSCCSLGFQDTVKRKGALDWNTNWCFCSDNTAVYYNKFHKLGKTGLSCTLIS